MNDEEIKNIYPVRMMTTGYVISQSLTPKWAGRKLNYNRRDLNKMRKLISKEFLKDMERKAAIFSECDKKNINVAKIMEQEPFRKAEACSFNVHANAKGEFF